MKQKDEDEEQNMYKETLLGDYSQEKCLFTSYFAFREGSKFFWILK